MKDNRNEKLISLSILGKPGSGKDTQAALLADYFNLNNIKTSTLINKKFEENHDDEDLLQHRDVFESGGLLDPVFVMSILQEHIEGLFETEEQKGGIISGGSPRTLYEAENILVVLEEYFRLENIFCVYLDITDEEGIERIIKRDSRPLDRDRNVLKYRMEEFYNHTMPVIEYFRSKGMLLEVDGMRGEDNVFVDIKEYLANKVKV